MTSGAASATLAGLLFVGLSLHIQVVVRHLEVRTLARITLSNFFVVLLVSLFALIPTGVATGTAIELLGIAFLSLVFTTPSLVEALRNRRLETLRLRVLIARFGLSTLSYVGLGAVAVLLFTGDFGDGLGWLVSVVVVLLFVAVRNTWDLLVTVAGKS